MPDVFMPTLGLQVSTVLGAGLSAAAVVVYYTLARHHKPGGVPLMVVLVVGAVGALVAGELGFDSAPDAEQRQRLAAERIGRKLTGRISEGARVLLFRPPVDAEWVSEDAPLPEGAAPASEAAARLERELQHSIERGAGVGVEVVASGMPRVGTEAYPDLEERSVTQPSEAWSEALEPYREAGIEAWISFAGLPADLEAVTSHQWSEPPLVAARLGDAQPQPPEWYDRVRRWIESGRLHVAVVPDPIEAGRMVTVTAENLDALEPAN